MDLDRAPEEFFWLGDVPAPAPLASQVLSRLARHGNPPPIRKLANGFYWRTATYNGAPWSRDETLTALLYAGAGCGFADYTAVNLMGWSRQVTAKTRIATLIRRKPLDKCIRYFRRSNKRRERLSFAEVTVIEAVRCWGSSRFSWDEAVEKASDGTAINKMRYDSVIRPEAIRWASETESPLVGALRKIYRHPYDFRDRIEDLCDRLPAVQRTGESLQAGYEESRAMIWGDWIPAFEEAVNMAKWLDYQPD